MSTTYDGAAADRLLSDWSGWWHRQLDAAEDWDREGLTLAQRAWKLALNDPYATALLNCVTGSVLGSGLRFVSTFQADLDPQVSADEMAVRAAITGAVAQHGRAGRLDPGAQLSRLAIERQLLVSGFVAGDGFAIRTWAPDRPGCADYGTAWRVIDAARVCNPKGAPNVPGQLVNGIELRGGVPVRLHYCDPAAQNWFSADWYASDGSRTVLHYAPDRDRAGSLRGFSKFAPILKLATHISKLALAHVSGKRVQAAHAMAIQSSDPKKAAEAHREQARLGPHSAIHDATVLFTGKDTTVTFPSYSYQGADYDAFIRSSLMAFCAAWGYPWQFVLHQLTEGNLASAQAALDQADRTTTIYQDSFIADVCDPITDSIIAEAHARGALALPASVPLHRLQAGTYDRPRRSDANRLRSREAAAKAIELGVSPSVALAELGYNHADEVRRTKQDRALEAELLGPPPAPPVAQPADAEAVDAEAPAEETVEDVPPVDAADARLSRADLLAALSGLSAGAARPITIHNHLPSPAPAAPLSLQVNVPPPQISVQAAAPAAAPNVSVHVNPTPVTIENTVEAAAPAAAPNVSVQVNPTPVTIDNQVVVPARTVKAVPQGDGSVLMVPQE